VLILFVGCRPSVPLGMTAIPLPDGRPGIGFDDLRFSPVLGRVLAPAGRSGNLDVIDPATRAVSAIGGFSMGIAFFGGHDEGPTSVDYGNGLLYLTDRSTMRLYIIDPGAGHTLGYAPVSASPDYARYVAATGEVWVTEPDTEKIEIFSVASGTRPVAVGSVAVPGGPESLIIDGTRARAYTFLWGGAAVAVDVQARKIVEQYANGCSASRGLALDEARGFLFAGCNEGKVVTLDVAHGGQPLGMVSSGAGVDVIDYSPLLRHVYAPGAKSETMAIVGVDASGALSVLGTTATVPDAHCVTADHRGNAYICDPENGQLLVFADPYPASGT
jgi:hypothetical protein